MVMKSAIFRDITPCRSSNVSQCFRGKYRLNLLGRIRRARYQREAGDEPPALLSVGFQRISRLCISEDSTHHNHRCENVKYYVHNSPLWELTILCNSFPDSAYVLISTSASSKAANLFEILT
jgi:hypothetical protein